MTISVMYSVGFLKKSAFEKIKFQSNVLGATAQPPANVVRCVVEHTIASTVDKGLGCNTLIHCLNK